MAHVIWQSGDTIVKAALPASTLTPEHQVAAMRDAGVLPFPPGTPHIVLADDHIAAPLPSSQLVVDFASANVTPRAAPPRQLTESDYADAIQAHIDTAAHARGYGNGALLASYIASTVPAWAAEAQTFIKWRDSVWLAAYGLLGSVKAGETAAPDLPVLIGNLPPIVWPAG